MANEKEDENVKIYTVSPIVPKGSDKNMSEIALDKEMDILESNDYYVTDTDEISETVTEPYCPLVFLDNNLACAPSPVDLSIENMMNKQTDFLEQPIPEESDTAAYKDYYDRAREIMFMSITALSNMYGSTIRAAIESFLDSNLRKKFIYYDDDGPCYLNVDNFICQIADIPHCERNIERMFKNWWNTMDCEKFTEDQKNSINFKTLEDCRDIMMNDISNNLTRFARQIAFCEPLYDGVTQSVTHIDSGERDKFLYYLSIDAQLRVTPDMYYVHQLSDYTCMAASISQIIEIILFQSVNTFNLLYFQERPNSSSYVRFDMPDMI